MIIREHWLLYPLLLDQGVAQSVMKREYIFRNNHSDQFGYFHQVFEEHFKEIYGIMVYQENVIKIAQYFGGLSLVDDDILQRLTSGKGRSIKKNSGSKRQFLYIM
nr:hypothetical protein [Chryseobacterium sp. G0162]